MLDCGVTVAAWQLLLLLLMNRLAAAALVNRDCIFYSNIKHVENLKVNSCSASSFRPGTPPQDAVIDIDSDRSKVWCPREQPEPHQMSQWLAVEFSRPVHIAVIIIERRQGGAEETIKKFVLQYRRSSSEPYRNYTQVDNQWKKSEVLTGIIDSMENKRFFDVTPAITAQSLRLFPLHQQQPVCMRLIFAGCSNYSGPISYTAPKGDSGMLGQFGSVQMQDRFYEDGMGLLTDAIVAGESPKSKSDAQLRFVGWRRRTLLTQYQFGRKRLMRQLLIHSSDDPQLATAGVAEVEAGFDDSGTGLKKWQVLNVLQRFTQSGIEQVTLALPAVVAETLSLRMRTSAAADWLLLSEVQISTDDPPPPTPTPLPTQPTPTTKAATQHTAAPPASQQPLPTQAKSHEPLDLSDAESAYIIIVAFSLLAAALLLLSVCLLCLRRRQLRRKKKHHELQCRDMHLDFSSGQPAALLHDKRFYSCVPANDDHHFNQYSSEQQEYATLSRCNSPPPYQSGHFARLTHNPMADRADMAAAASLLGTLAMQDQQQQQQQRLQMQMQQMASPRIQRSPLQQQQQQQQQASSGYYAIGYYNAGHPTLGLPARSRNLQQQQQQQQQQQLPPPPPPPPAASAVSEEFHVQGAAGNSTYHMYTCSPAAAAADADNQLQQLQTARSRVALSEQLLGSGQFGEVRLVSWTMPSGQQLPAVAKMLRGDASDKAREQFFNEMLLAARLKNKNEGNIVQTLAVVTDDPQLIIDEMPQLGDLHQLLSRVPAAVADEAVAFGVAGAAMSLALQVAQGMKFLESQQLAHRDLACRNCLLTGSFSVKVTDIGMVRQQYSSHYCRLQGRGLLPIRWMSWEAVLHAAYSNKSDVCSFAVLLWELLTLCRQLPFAALSEEAIVANCRRIELCDMQAQPLNCPSGCPQEIYDLMSSCWQRDVDSRPTFHEIYQFLLHKCVGYAPEADPLLRWISSGLSL